MKKGIILILVLVFAGSLMKCTQEKPLKTIENLKAAYNGESTASAKYAKFAEKANEEGLDTLAKMFQATSKAEAIHADNHKKVLEKLGEKIEAPTLGTFEVKTTKENLEDAIKGESYEIETMYPEFITASETEKAADAKKSFTWAMDTEKKHKEFYQKALDAVNAGSESTLPVSWSVCPVCGNTYDAASVKEACDFCQTTKDKFVVF
jgi:rubrerythrin